MRHMVVSYDVVEDSKRTRLARFLEGYLQRVQKSVFEGEVSDGELEALKEGIERRIDREGDSVRLYTLCARCQGVTEIIGTGVFVERDEDDVVI